jgi:hypothetical protein
VSDTIFAIDSGGSLRRLTQTAYATESNLQKLLADHPELLVTGDSSAGSTKLMLIGAEVSLRGDHDDSGTWKVDHLMVDSQGVLWIIEVKRSTDSRIRREVVGQMLDYGANAVLYWPQEHLKGTFAETTQMLTGADPETRLRALIGPDADIDQFWNDVQTNLQAGKLKLVFVADRIPSELRRVIEFLNLQMTPAEVVGIELRQFADENYRLLVPKVLGVSTESSAKKGRAQSSGPYDYEFYRANGHSPEAIQALQEYVEELTRLCEQHGWPLEPRFNKGYVAFKKGSRALFGIWWYDTKRDLKIYFRVPKDVAEEVASQNNYSWQIYIDEWKQAVFKLWPGQTLSLSDYLPMMKASLAAI